MAKAFFFDRDGVVNQVPQEGKRYIETWEEFHLMPGFVDVMRQVSDAGYVSVVITNQRGVGRGIVPQEELDRIHGNLKRELEEVHGLTLTDIYYCPHAEDGCACRKPAPGMILEAAETHNLDLSGSWMVGDQPKDIEAGRAAGCRTIYVGEREDVEADVCVASMRELDSLIAELPDMR